MPDGTVYAQGWTLEDIQWSRFDPAKVTPAMLAAVKAAALVEFNAPDYVSYLKRIFTDGCPETLAAIEQWGCEESQHGRALGRWAEMADPDFRLDEAFARFRKGYRPAHFESLEANSVRGSRRGEMIARCVVESGTSSYYSAVRDATDEPVLKEIASRIASDEYRHYKLFFDTLNAQSEPDLPFRASAASTNCSCSTLASPRSATSRETAGASRRYLFERWKISSPPGLRCSR